LPNAFPYVMVFLFSSYYLGQKVFAQKGELQFVKTQGVVAVCALFCVSRYFRNICTYNYAPMSAEKPRKQFSNCKYWLRLCSSQQSTSDLVYGKHSVDANDQSWTL